MAHGSRLMTLASRLVAQSWWLMAKKNLALGPPGPGPSAKFFGAMSNTSLEDWAMSHDPLTMNNWLLHELLDSKVFKVSKLPKFRSFKVQEFHNFKLSKFQISELQHLPTFQQSKNGRARYTHLPKLSKFQIARFAQNNISKNELFFLVFIEVFLQ